MLNEPNTILRLNRLLLTGAAGRLGRELRPRLARYCNTLVLNDRVALGEAASGEEIHICDLADAAAIDGAVDGVNSVVHFGAVIEEEWEQLLAANIVGVRNVYEACRRHGVRRVVFASSNHVTGFYPQSEVITIRERPRPDGMYGLSKAFGENLAEHYWCRYGIETVSLRIGSCFAEPQDTRMLATWLSFDDLERLIISSLTTPMVGHTIIYGMSDNQASWWDNRYASHLGYRPLDRAEAFRRRIERHDTGERWSMLYQGGALATKELIDG